MQIAVICLFLKIDPLLLAANFTAKMHLAVIKNYGSKNRNYG